MKITIFLSGFSMTAFAASGVFFLRFWLTSRDLFFLLFSVACFLISSERVAALAVPASLDATPHVVESLFWLYIIRLLAFTAIAAAILHKNRNGKTP